MYALGKINIHLQKKVEELEEKFSASRAELEGMEALRNKLSDVEKSYKDLETSKEVRLCTILL